MYCIYTYSKPPLRNQANVTDDADEKSYVLNLTPNLFREMRWLIGSAPDFWGRGPGFEFYL